MVLLGKYLLPVWLVGVTFDVILCSPELHRIVFRTHRRIRDRDVHKKQDYRGTRPPTYQESFEENWTLSTSKPFRKTNRQKSRTTQRPADLIAITANYGEKLPPRLYEDYYSYYRNPNNTVEYSTSETRQENRLLTPHQHRDKSTSSTTPKPTTKGYEVYEEIVGDLLPPPEPRININLQNVALLSNTSSVEDLSKENATEITTKNPGRRGKSRRHRNLA